MRLGPELAETGLNPSPTPVHMTENSLAQRVVEQFFFWGGFRRVFSQRKSESK